MSMDDRGADASASGAGREAGARALLAEGREAGVRALLAEDREAGARVLLAEGG